MDMIAIRKDHGNGKLVVDGFRGDLFEIVLIQVKGGGSRLPTAADVDRLMKVKKYYRADRIILAEWKLREKLRLSALHRRRWERVEAPEVFGRLR